MNGQSNEDLQPLPRLRIAHIFVWMFASAVLLTAMRQVHHFYVGQSGSGVSAGQQRYLGALFAFTSITGGAGLLAILLGIQRRRVGLPSFTAPGHWLVILMLVHSINYAILFPISIWFQQNFYLDRWIFFGLFSVGHIMTIAVAIVAWKRSSPIWFWRVFFLLQIPSAVTGCLIILGLGPLLPFTIVSEVMTWLTTLALFIAVGTDLLVKRSWDWLHWIGVILQMSAFALGMVSRLVI